MLILDSPEQLRAEPELVRFLHLVLLSCIRDRSERIEFRSVEDGWLLYQRIDGRDWEMVSPPETVQPAVKQTIRSAARLVAPERPELTSVAGWPEARFEPHEIGWLTYQLRGRLLDMAVRIDLREPWGRITIELDDADQLADLAAEVLAAYFDADEPA